MVALSKFHYLIEAEIEDHELEASLSNVDPVSKTKNVTKMHLILWFAKGQMF